MVTVVVTRLVTREAPLGLTVREMASRAGGQEMTSLPSPSHTSSSARGQAATSSTEEEVGEFSSMDTDRRWRLGRARATGGEGRDTDLARDYRGSSSSR